MVLIQVDERSFFWEKGEYELCVFIKQILLTQ